jgi:hypothetical protein
MCSLAEVCNMLAARMAAVSARLQSSSARAGASKLCRWTLIRRGLRAARLLRPLAGLEGRRVPCLPNPNYKIEGKSLWCTDEL